MSGRRSSTDAMAAKLIHQRGIAAIWELHLSAAEAYRRGATQGAAYLIHLADAAEEEFRRRADPGAAQSQG
jgi:hypothetical protein